jgi:hypothetical protein
MMKSVRSARLTPALIALACLLLGCAMGQPGAKVAIDQTGGATPRDARYLIDGEAYALHDGQAVVETAPKAASKTEIKVFGEPVRGDLDGDGVADAAVLLVQTTGGSGTFYYVAAAFNRGGMFYGTQAVFIGDRILPRQLTIRYGVVIVDYADRLPDQSMATPPSVEVSKYLVSRAERLDEIFLEDGELIAAGEVVIGHEVRSFTPCGASQAAWLLGDSPALLAVMAAYHLDMSDAPPFTPLFMVLTGRPEVPPVDGFGAGYPAGFLVTQLVHSLPGITCAR